MRGALPVNAFSVMMCKTMELIGHTYKNIINVKTCLYVMKEISFRKPKPDMVEDGFTSSQDLVGAKIFEYQITNI